MATLRLDIPGFEYIFPRDVGQAEGGRLHKGIDYYPADGLRIVIHGPPGSGKTTLALQMAISAAFVERKSVIYLTKDTSPGTLIDRIADFDLFVEGGVELYKTKMALQEIVKAGYGIRDPMVKLDTSQKWHAGAPDGDAWRWEGNVLQDPIRDPAGKPADASRMPVLCFGRKGDVFSQMIRCQVLENLRDILKGKSRPEIDESMLDMLDPIMGCSLITFAKLDAGTAGRFEKDRYATEGNFFKGLQRLVPGLAEIWNWLGEKDDEVVDRMLGRDAEWARREDLVEEVRRRIREDARRLAGKGSQNSWAITELEQRYAEKRDVIRRLARLLGVRYITWGNALIVCDSVQPDRLEECLCHCWERARAEQPDQLPVWVFVLESREMPLAMSAAFAPDVQIEMGMRNLSHGVSVTTLQVHKARFQDVRREAFEFVVQGGGRTAAEQAVAAPREGDSWVRPLTRRKAPGITVLPTLPARVRATPPGRGGEEEQEIRFGSDIDKNLICGTPYAFGVGMGDDRVRWLKSGCTLLLTENRCHSTAFGMHFLLGGNYLDDNLERLQHAGNVIAVFPDGDLGRLVTDIGAMAVCHACETDGKWAALAHEARRRRTETHFDILLPSRFGDCFHVFAATPHVQWMSEEQIVDSIEWLIKEAEKTGPVRRLLFNRVGRVAASWPLVKDVTTLVASVVKLCQAKGIGVMVIDDEADQSSSAGHIVSRWVNVANNIIRLKRVTIQGRQSVAIETVRIDGYEVSPLRPRELEMYVASSSDQGERRHRLRITDSFRGYSGIYGENPKHCRIRLDLSYDQEDSPLHVEARQIKTNMDMLFEDIDVRLHGPNDRPGINFALTNLATVPHDTCHVTAIDEIWLCELTRAATLPGTTHKKEPVLHEFGLAELKAIVPEAIGGADSIDGITRNYATQALAIGRWQQGHTPERNEPLPAVPYYHNWGLFCGMPLREGFGGSMEGGAELPWDVWVRETNAAAQGGVPWTELRQMAVAWNAPGGLCQAVQEYLRRKGGGRNLRVWAFGFASATQESVSSFFLELLMARMKGDELFRTADGKQLSFNVERWAEWTEVAELLRALLSQEQRVALGWPEGSQKKRQEPVVLHLLSRQWITTVPSLRHPLETVVRTTCLRELPLWATATPDHGHWMEYLSGALGLPRGKESGFPAPEGATPGGKGSFGMPVSGTWYLAALRGGNIDLSSDIIRELVSEKRELNRLRNMTGAPVCRNYYEQGLCGLPYAKQITNAIRGEKDEKLRVVFPFCRVLIREYAKVSMEIHALVRNAMRGERSIGDIVREHLNHIGTIQG